MSNCGIYYIQNKVTKQLYIGQSRNLHRRKVKHFSQLRSNTHFNQHLQRSFNKYGEENFEFNVIEYCDPSTLDELEIAYMNLYNVQQNGFNVRDGGEAIPDNSGEKNGMYGKQAPNRRQDINNCIDELIKEYKYGTPISYIAKEWGTARQVIRRKLREQLSKEEMEEINNQNRRSDLIIKNHNKGFSHELPSRLNMSASHNSSGYYRVSFDSHSQRWIYKWYDDSKKRRKITAKSIEELEIKVKSKNLEWIKFKEGQ